MNYFVHYVGYIMSAFKIFAVFFKFNIYVRIGCGIVNFFYYNINYYSSVTYIIFSIGQETVRQS